MSLNAPCKFNELTEEEQYEAKLYAYQNINLSTRQIANNICDKYNCVVSHTSVANWKKEKPICSTNQLVLSNSQSSIKKDFSNEDLEKSLSEIKNDFNKLLENKITTSEKLVAILESGIIRKELISTLIDSLVMERLIKLKHGVIISGDELRVLTKLAQVYGNNPSEIVKMANFTDYNESPIAEQIELEFN